MVTTELKTENWVSPSLTARPWKVTIPNPERFVFQPSFFQGPSPFGNGSSNQDSICETGFMLHTLMKKYWTSKMLKLSGQENMIMTMMMMMMMMMMMKRLYMKTMLLVTNKWWSLLSTKSTNYLQIHSVSWRSPPISPLGRADSAAQDLTSGDHGVQSMHPGQILNQDVGI